MTMFDGHLFNQKLYFFSLIHAFADYFLTKLNKCHMFDSFSQFSYYMYCWLLLMIPDSLDKRRNCLWQSVPPFCHILNHFNKISNTVYQSRFIYYFLLSNSRESSEFCTRLEICVIFILKGHVTKNSKCP